MKIRFLILLAVSAMMAQFANAQDDYLNTFCENSKNPLTFKFKAMDSSNLMAFRNHGGIGNQGVCWWHSRFQRNALYLTIFKAENPRDSDDVLRTKIKQIRNGKQIVVINGFEDFFEFSSEKEKLIQRELEKWQKSDGIIKFKWVQGLRGKPTLEPQQMRAMLDDLYERVVTNGQITYQKLQFKGIGAHAWLVVDMERTFNGYRLYVIDSALPTDILVYDYVQGMTAFDHALFGRFAPRTEFENETTQVLDVIRRNCNY